MQVRVTQWYTKKVEIEGNRTAVIDATSIAEARRVFAEGGVEWEESQEEQGDVETEESELEFEKID